MSRTRLSRTTSQLLGRVQWLAAIIALQWLGMIAPLATLLALLCGTTFYHFWAASLWLLPAFFMLLLGVFRSKSHWFRWAVFQYLGVSSVCFSAAIAGAVLSAFLPYTTAGVCALILAVILCLWALYSAQKIHNTALRISHPKIDRKLRLVQISDVHIGSRKPDFLRKVVDQVNQHAPDLLLITGDLIDENVSFDDMAALKSINCPALYCSGNHERYIRYSDMLDIIAAHGVRVLNDEFVDCLGLRLVGIGDREKADQAIMALDQLYSTQPSKTFDATSGSDDNQTSPFSILLYHQPDIWHAAKRHGIELMLSGHTHKGQIWPFGLLVRTRYQYVAGHFQDSLNHLFVSQGTGTWGPQMRLGTQCEMTVIDVLPD